MAIKSFVLPSFYQDSVALMRTAHAIRGREGVSEAAALMGTPANHAILEKAGLSTPETLAAGPNDLMLSVLATSEEAAEAALAAVQEQLLSRRSQGEADGEDTYNPQTLETALERMPSANLAAISVPGAFARNEAMKALRQGLHVFLFSDNVSIEDEVALKKEAIRRGLLLMGPDCGTAYLSGFGVGFANEVGKGRVGCVAASGTGLQAVACRLVALGEGVSQGIGVGGRDLSAAVGGMMTEHALRLLGRDAETGAVVLIAKSIDEGLIPRLQQTLEGLEKPSVVVGFDNQPRSVNGVDWVQTLDAAAEAAVAKLQQKSWTPGAFSEPDRVRSMLGENCEGSGILGLYTGGTLAHEGQGILAPLLGDVAWNAFPDEVSTPHCIVDLGDDAYTVGRPHPMLDPDARAEHLLKLERWPSVGVVLLDLVLGRSSHDDPAQALCGAIRKVTPALASTGRRVRFVASVLGTPDDPQDLGMQVAELESAGVVVLPSNAQAARFAALLVRPQLLETFLGGVG